MTIVVLADESNPACVLVERSRVMHVRARLHARRLDRALAAGVCADTNAELSVRAHLLIGSRARRRLAKALRRLLDDAGRPLPVKSFNVPLCRRKIRRSRRTLEVLAERLVSGDPVDPCGLAQLHLLLVDGDGPVYDRPGADDLEPTLQRAAAALTVQVRRGWAAPGDDGRELV